MMFRSSLWGSGQCFVMMRALLTPLTSSVSPPPRPLCGMSRQGPRGTLSSLGISSWGPVRRHQGHAHEHQQQSESSVLDSPSFHDAPPKFKSEARKRLQVRSRAARDLINVDNHESKNTLTMQGFAKLPWEVSMSPESAAKKLGSFLGLPDLAPASVLNLDVDQV